ncbi:MAG: NRDE family protein [Deltaproteobacteria bacterium]|nr:NRDE family protein [Deltaproteobacteria bacterium]
MCTITILRGVHPRHPLLVAANRDEYRSRAWDPPALLHPSPRAWGGRDRAKGGTWLGVTERGFFVGLTNQRTYRPADPSRRSRGEVVTEALRLNETARVEALLGALDPRDYNPFNLVFGDLSALRVAYVRPEGLQVHPLGDGVHVLANDRLRAPTMPKTLRAEALARALPEGPWEAVQHRLGALLGDHHTPEDGLLPEPPAGALMPRMLLKALQALCVHAGVYGTVSSTVLSLGRERVERYLFAPGPPCRTAFTEVPR